MADYKKILIAGNPALTTDNMHPDHFGYLGGEKGYDGEKGAGGPGGQKGQTGAAGEIKVLEVAAAMRGKRELKVILEYKEI